MAAVAAAPFASTLRRAGRLLRRIPRASRTPLDPPPTRIDACAGRGARHITPSGRGACNPGRAALGACRLAAERGSCSSEEVPAIQANHRASARRCRLSVSCRAGGPARCGGTPNAAGGVLSALDWSQAPSLPPAPPPLRRASWVRALTRAAGVGRQRQRDRSDRETEREAGTEEGKGQRQRQSETGKDSLNERGQRIRGGGVAQNEGSERARERARAE
jgi:hypothetical protein